jgi:hypothetical protein
MGEWADRWSALSLFRETPSAASRPTAKACTLVTPRPRPLRYSGAMLKRIALLLFTASLVLPAHAARKPRSATPPAPPAVTVDTHADTPSEYMKKPFDLGVRNEQGHFDYARMKAGQLDAEFFAAYVPAKYANKGAAAYCMRIMETIHEMADGYAAHVRFTTTSTAIRNNVRDG